MGRRPYYAEYINHCLRFYCRNIERPSAFKSEADKKNWEACDFAMKVYTSEERDILRSVYSMNNTMADNVYHIAGTYNVCQDLVWNLINDAGRRIAKRRGLL